MTRRTKLPSNNAPPRTLRSFHNPWLIPTKEVSYHGVDANAKKINICVPIDKWQFFKGLRPGGGTISSTINLLLEALEAECRRRGITSVEHGGDFEKLVANCKIGEGE